MLLLMRCILGKLLLYCNLLYCTCLVPGKTCEVPGTAAQTVPLLRQRSYICRAFNHYLFHESSKNFSRFFFSPIRLENYASSVLTLIQKL